MSSLINIGVSKLGTSSSPYVLRTILGSCVGICIYDRTKKKGGMAHVLLPNCVRNGAPEKFADTAIPILIKKLIRDGCNRDFLSAKIAGGASMFKFSAHLSLANIGKRNIEESRRVLKENGIPLVSEDVGGTVGRVLDFFLEDGRLKIKAAGKEKIFYKV